MDTVSRLEACSDVMRALTVTALPSQHRSGELCEHDWAHGVGVCWFASNILCVDCAVEALSSPLVFDCDIVIDVLRGDSPVRG